MAFWFVLFLVILRLFCLKGKRGCAWIMQKFINSMKWNFFIRFGIELMLMGFINVNIHLFYLTSFNNYKDYCSYILAILIGIYLLFIYVMSFILLIVYQKRIRKRPDDKSMESWSTLFEDMNVKSFGSTMYVFYFLTHWIIFGIIIAHFKMAPRF